MDSYKPSILLLAALTVEPHFLPSESLWGGRASKHVKEMWKFSKEAYAIASFFSFRGRLWVRSVRLCVCAPLQLGCPGFCTMSLGAVEGEGGIPEITRDAEGRLLRTCGCVPAVTQFLPRKQSFL